MDFLMKSGLKCVDSDGRNVKFDILIKADEKSKDWHSTQGSYFGYRRVSQLMLDKINEMTQPYRRYGWFGSSIISLDGKLCLPSTNTSKFVHGKRLVAISSDFKTAKQQLTALQETQDVHGKTFTKMQGEISQLKQDLESSIKLSNNLLCILQELRPEHPELAQLKPALVKVDVAPLEPNGEGINYARFFITGGQQSEPGQLITPIINTKKNY
jgi:hypothetical protein